MERIIPEVRKIAQRIGDAESKRQKLAEFVREIGPEVNLTQKVSPDTLDNVKVVGVDGGLAKKSLHGFDFILTRGVGVCFHYGNGGIKSVDYSPSRFPAPRPFILEALTDLDLAHSASIYRQMTEIEAARGCIKKFKPDILLMDGMIAPHYSDRPSRSSAVRNIYESLLTEYGKLYSDAEDSGTLLAGVIEDSRGTRFCDMIRRDVLSKVSHKIIPELGRILECTRDTNLLFWVLERGEMTPPFPYSDRPGEHPVLRDLGERGQQLSSFFLKTAEWDRPVRVDFLQSGDVTRLASVLLAISGQHSGYGLPAPLIEADSVAKLSDMEMEKFYSQVLNFAGNLPSIMSLRSDQRPF